MAETIHIVCVVMAVNCTIGWFFSLDMGKNSKIGSSPADCFLCIFFACIFSIGAGFSYTIKNCEGGKQESIVNVCMQDRTVETCILLRDFRGDEDLVKTCLSNKLNSVESCKAYLNNFSPVQIENGKNLLPFQINMVGPSGSAQLRIGNEGKGGEESNE